MERGPRGPETPRETQELLRTPEQVFDSNKEAAERQNKEVIERLMRRGEIQRSNDNVEFETVETGKGSAPRIQIAWPTNRQSGHILNLEPIVEGKGAERGIFGYTGEYGVAKREGLNYRMTDERVSLSELFEVPDDLNIIIEPTINRWAVEAGEDPLTTAIFGKNARKMYVGLGFLFLGREWMHVGMHEAGHLPNNHDENLAWSIANKKYAQIHKPRKTDIIAGKDIGQFGLLKSPESRYYGKTPRLGDVAKYGLTTHARSGNAKIPKQWDQERILRDFQSIILAADQTYEDFIGR